MAFMLDLMGSDKQTRKRPASIVRATSPGKPHGGTGEWCTQRNHVHTKFLSGAVERRTRSPRVRQVKIQH